MCLEVLGIWGLKSHPHVCSASTLRTGSLLVPVLAINGREQRRDLGACVMPLREQRLALGVFVSEGAEPPVDVQ